MNSFERSSRLLHHRPRGNVVEGNWRPSRGPWRRTGRTPGLRPTTLEPGVAGDLHLTSRVCSREGCRERTYGQSSQDQYYLRQANFDQDDRRFSYSDSEKCMHNGNYLIMWPHIAVFVNHYGHFHSQIGIIRRTWRRFAPCRFNIETLGST